MNLFVGRTKYAGTRFRDKDVMEHGDYKYLAYVSFLAGKITWYVNAESLPEEVKSKIVKESKRLREKFYIMLDKMDDNKCYYYLLDLMDTTTSNYVINKLPGNINAKIDYMCDVLEKKSTWR